MGTDCRNRTCSIEFANIYLLSDCILKKTFLVLAIAVTPTDNNHFGCKINACLTLIPQTYTSVSLISRTVYILLIANIYFYRLHLEENSLGFGNRSNSHRQQPFEL